MIHPTTELEAVNAMLATIGEIPISSIEGGTHADVMIALGTLRQVSREVQLMGWYFNIEYNYDLPPDLDGRIILPSNIISVDVEPRTAGFMKEPLEELPETAKAYITVRASHVFVSRVVGSETLQQFTRQDEAQTYAALPPRQPRRQQGEGPDQAVQLVRFVRSFFHCAKTS